METKNFNRKPLFRMVYALIFILIASSIALLIYMLSSGRWQEVDAALELFSLSLICLSGVINKKHDLTIDYTNKEVRSNLKFGKKESCCIPFDAISGVYIYRADQLKNEIQLKKYPPQTLVIEKKYTKKYTKEYIPLKFFDAETVQTFIKELEKVRESA